LPRRLEIAVSIEPDEAGTAGALFHARNRLDERFLLLNGGSLLDGNLAALLADAARDDPAVVAGRLAVTTLPDTGRYGVVTLAGDVVTGFHARPSIAGQAGLIHAGIAVLHRRILDTLPPRGSLERDVLPRLAATGALRATALPGWFIDIGEPDDLARAQAELPRRLRRPALFLDRDGVVNRDLGYVGSRDRFEWTADSRAAIRAASGAGWHVFIVTNQSGIAREYYREVDLVALHDWMVDEVRHAGGTIDDLRYCPHHPEATHAAYRRRCDCRKPAPGMLRDLLHRWQVEPESCVLVGDQPTDLAAAAAAGVRGIGFTGGSLLDAVVPLLDRAMHNVNCYRN
ncbi:MAG TPA: HAD-IIIA family hydrolase, partial [Acetobacteraceae bacterium]|nr:HAD-IIIA family hydrolase [Acetobacteraceae bacterium]